MTDARTFTTEWRVSGSLRWLAWEGAGVAAAFPTREGGVSPAPYDSLNLGLSVDDDVALVLRNRSRYWAAIALSPDRIVVPGQVHGTRLAWVDDVQAGRGAASSSGVIAGTDGLLTATPGLGLAVSYADCVPVVIAAGTDEGPALAVVHAGWRGMLAGIVGQAAAELASRGRLLGAVVGPSIGPCCFTVDDDLRARFEARFRVSADAAGGTGQVPGGTAHRSAAASPGASRVDLWACAQADLEATGVPAEGITVTGLCTADDGRFFSHRRDAGRTGRHMAIAWRQEAPGGPRS